MIDREGHREFHISMYRFTYSLTCVSSVLVRLRAIVHLPFPTNRQCLASLKERSVLHNRCSRMGDSSHDCVTEQSL